MPTFTIETTYHLPVYRQRSYDAATVAEACRNAVSDDDWSGERHDYEAAGKAYVTGIWSGSGAAYRGEPVLVPSQFCEMFEGKADHFGVLLALLKQPAQAGGLSAVDFARWLPLAQALVAKAEAILAGDCVRTDVRGRSPPVIEYCVRGTPPGRSAEAEGVDRCTSAACGDVELSS